MNANLKNLEPLVREVQQRLLTGDYEVVRVELKDYIVGEFFSTSINVGGLVTTFAYSRKHILFGHNNPMESLLTEEEVEQLASTMWNRFFEQLSAEEQRKIVIKEEMNNEEKYYERFNPNKR